MFLRHHSTNLAYRQRGSLMAAEVRIYNMQKLLKKTFQMVNKIMRDFLR